MLPFRGSTVFKRLAYVTCVALLFSVGAALSYNYDLRVQIDRHTRGIDDSLGYMPSYERESGPQIAMIYVGSSTCPWSNVQGLPDAVETIKRRLASYASEHGLSFKALGIALDWSPERGLDHLAKFGLFDEVSAGYGWGNSLAIQHLRSDGSVPPATPLIIVYRQTFVAQRDSSDAFIYEESHRLALLVKRGSQEIAEWADSGVPLAEVDLTGS